VGTVVELVTRGGNVNKYEPLGLPPGSVRSIIALALVTALIYGVADVQDLVAVVVGFYFGSRTSQ
jgi:hypothetical protein